MKVELLLRKMAQGFCFIIQLAQSAADNPAQMGFLKMWLPRCQMDLSDAH
jgi:hypothetical protein